MGEVYRAKDTRLGRDVAIKVLPETIVKDADRLHRFEQEARTIAALNHPNILGIHDIGTYGASSTKKQQRDDSFRIVAPYFKTNQSQPNSTRVHHG
jgi:serine/threonine protein kinase